MHALHHLIHEEHSKDGEEGSPTVAKITAMVVLVTASFVVGALPIKLNTWFHWESDANQHGLVKFLLGIGGGVLLCTTFIHMLPEVNESFEQFDITPNMHYAEILMCIGFFTMYFVEECVHMYLKYKEREPSKEESSRSSGPDLDVIKRSLSIRRGEDQAEINALKEEMMAHKHGNEGHSHVAIQPNGSFIAIIRGLLVVLGISVHELFEGLAIGLESSPSNVWYMFGAVSAHKLVIAFCIGIELVTSGLKTIYIVMYMFLFAIVNPIGIGTGIIISNNSDSFTNLVSVILQGLATGTLIKTNPLRIPCYANSSDDHHHDHKSYESCYNNDTTLAKVLAMSILFVISFLIGILPIKLNKWFDWTSEAKHSVFVKFLLGMGGGILLCMTFIHLLPEVKTKIEGNHISAYISKRLAEILLCTGFFAMYLIEECVHSYLHYREEHLLLRTSLRIRRGEHLETMLKQDAMHSNQEGHSHGASFDTSNTIAIIRGLLVVLALSIHELFEGLAVGLETSPKSVWYMFGAINAHKQVIAFCIGIELVSSKLKTWVIIIYAFIFAIVSPLGIGVGILVCNFRQSTATISVILQGLASGTLVYVIFFEILQGEKKSGLLQYFAILLGFSIMLLLTFIDLAHTHN
ncbi:unnamed protein product [Phyllotreta striolata]|uniref:Uncharacterized protein n=1 Tax=Phyllotreta striolata TaxID=444603 RepID=A0A9N9TRP5_PHYSR|nr:unnamed protein product [Phyllotreta striolata]